MLSGSITYLTFPSPSHLLTCSEDGTICLFRSRDWVLLRIFKGHKGRVNAVAVHPSGKLALSVGRDKTIRMWDFMRGKPAGSTKIYKGELPVLCPLNRNDKSVRRGRARPLVTFRKVLCYANPKLHRNLLDVNDHPAPNYPYVTHSRLTVCLTWG